MERLASVSVDLDSLPHYCRIHGLPLSILKDGAGKQWDARITKVFIDTVQTHGDPNDDHGHVHHHETRTDSGIIIPTPSEPLR